MAKLPEYFHFRVLGGVTKIGLQDVSDHDWVEVVRCKDCEFWTKQKNSLQGRCALSGGYPTGYWYCANGRKEMERG